MSRRDSSDLDSTPLILIVDDAKESAEAISQMLRAADFRTITADSMESGLSIAERYAPGAILLSAELESDRGADTCITLKDRLTTTDIPVIMIAASLESDAVVQHCFDAGAHDLLARPLRRTLLLARLRVVLRECRLRDEYKRYATQDAATGLDNRRHFFMHLTETVATAERLNREAYLLICDLDELATTNTRYGYDLGDEVIAMLARLTRRLLSVDCRVGRIAGDAVGILLKNCDEARAVATAERILKTFEAIAFDADSKPKHFSLSCGMSRCLPGGEPHSPDDFMAEADMALFVAKDRGGRQICRYWQIDPKRLEGISPAKRHSRRIRRRRTERGFLGGEANEQASARAE